LVEQIDRDDVLDRGAGPVGEVPHHGRDDVPGHDHLRPVVGEGALQLVGRVEGVVLHDDGADAQGRVEHRDALGTVGQQHGDTVAGRYTQAAQALGGAAHVPAEVGVGRQAAEELGGGPGRIGADDVVELVDQRGGAVVEVLRGPGRVVDGPR